MRNPRNFLIRKLNFVLRVNQAEDKSFQVLSGVWTEIRTISIQIIRHPILRCPSLLCLYRDNLNVIFYLIQNVQSLHCLYCRTFQESSTSQRYYISIFHVYYILRVRKQRGLKCFFSPLPAVSTRVPGPWIYETPSHPPSISKPSIFFSCHQCAKFSFITVYPLGIGTSRLLPAPFYADSSDSDYMLTRASQASGIWK